jgi:alcohol dehydrogenase
MRAVQIPRAGGPLELVEREVPEPGTGTVRIKVQACGICHSDSVIKEGLFPGISYPRVPGHEVIGIVDAVGSGVSGWAEGQRVGVGWNGGYCGYCDACRRGNFFGCQTATYVTGMTSDGGYADYMVARAEALARMPEELSPVEAAPLMCAGVTTYNCLRNSGARPGDVVAVVGLGGLGHLAVQYAAKMGYKAVAIDRGRDKEEFAKTLGAWRYIDNKAQDPSSELQKVGGAQVVVGTVAAGEAMAAVIGGLAVNGTLMVVGVPPSMQIFPAQLVLSARSVKGWYSGVSIDSQDTLSFSVLTGVRSMNEVLPLERAAEGYERMMKGEARFRVVLTTGEIAG